MPSPLPILLSAHPAAHGVGGGSCRRQIHKCANSSNSGTAQGVGSGWGKGGAEKPLFLPRSVLSTRVLFFLFESIGFF